MVRPIQGLVLLAAFFFTVPASMSQEPDKNPKAKIEIRWVEKEFTEGLTEEKGYMAGYFPKDMVYPHKKPALVLTKAQVAEARLKTLDFSNSGSGIQYQVELHLTDEARKQLAAACEGNEMRLLTIAVDGKFKGVHRYEKDKNNKSAPKQTRAETFVPTLGYYAVEAEAQRIVDAFK